MANYKSERRKDLGKWLEKFFDIDHSDPFEVIRLAEAGFSLVNVINKYNDIIPKIRLDILKELLRILPHGQLRLDVVGEILASDPTFKESNFKFNKEYLNHYNMINPITWNTPEHLDLNREIFYSIVNTSINAEYNHIFPPPSPNLIELFNTSPNKLTCQEFVADLKRFVSNPIFKAQHWSNAICQLNEFSPTSEETFWANSFLDNAKMQYESVQDSLIIDNNRILQTKTLSLKYEEQTITSILATRILIDFFELDGQYHYSFCRNPQCGRFYYHTQDSRKSKPLKWCGRKCNNAVNNPKNQTKHHNLQTK